MGTRKAGLNLLMPTTAGDLVMEASSHGMNTTFFKCSIKNRTPTDYYKMQQQNGDEKESGYGGSRSSTDTVTESETEVTTPDTEMFDNAFDLAQGVEGQIKPMEQLNHDYDTMPTRALGLKTLSEGSDHSDCFGSDSQNVKPDSITVSNFSHTSGRHMSSSQMEKFKSNESMQMTQPVHVNYKHTYDTAKQRCHELSQLPASLTSLPTCSKDRSRWTEKELNNHLRHFRHDIQKQYIDSMTRKGESPEKIQCIGQQLLSINYDIPIIGKC